jgi:hypothetical protein
MRRWVLGVAILSAWTGCALDFAEGPHSGPGDDDLDGDVTDPFGNDGSIKVPPAPDASEPSRWSSIDLRSIASVADAGAGAPTMGAAAFDSTSGVLYVFPAADGAPMLRFDTKLPFDALGSWLAKPSLIGASSAAYCVDDRKLYVASPSGGRIASYVTSTAFDTSAFGLEKLAMPDGGKSYGSFDGASCFPRSGLFVAAGDGSDSVHKNLEKGAEPAWDRGGAGVFRGVGHYQPSSSGGTPDSSSPTDVSFGVPENGTQTTSLSSGQSRWSKSSVVDLRTVGIAAGEHFSGAIDDGKYLYLVPSASQFSQEDASAPPTYVHRYDLSKKMTDPGAWQVGPGLAAFTGHGGVFDGRYVYFAPGSPRDGSTTLVRYDTTGEFGIASSWASVDMTPFIPAPAAGATYRGLAFDGHYLYFVPRVGLAVLRYETDATAIPATYAGSFY